METSSSSAAEQRALLPVPVVICRPSKRRSRARLRQGVTRDVLLVEHRDEVFARLSADIDRAGFAVHRAQSASEASEYRRIGSAAFVIANCDLPDETGWLMATKWALSRSHARVWLYTGWESFQDRLWTELTCIEQLIYYYGDILRLSAAIANVLRAAK